MADHVARLRPVQCYFSPAEVAALATYASARRVSSAAAVREAVRRLLSPAGDLLVALEEARPGSLDRLARGETITIGVRP